MNQFVIRDMIANRKKYILLILVMAVSICLTMGILILHGTMAKRIFVLTENLEADSAITAVTNETFGMDIAKQIAEISSVSDIDLQLEYNTDAEICGVVKSVWLLGSSEKSMDVDQIEVVDGRTIAFGEGKREILVDRKVARKENLVVGNKIAVIIKGAAMEFEVVGIYERNRFSMQPCYEFYVDGAMLQKELGQVERYNKVNVVTADKSFQTVSRINEEMKHMYPKLFSFETIFDREMAARKDLSSFSMILWAVLAIFILGSIYLVYHSFCIRMNERLRTIAIFKSLGAKESQIKWSFLKEGFLAGAAGSIIGILIGILIGFLMCYLYAEKDYEEVGSYFTIKVVYVLGCFFLCFVVVYAGSIIPILKITKISPVSAMKNISLQTYSRISGRNQKIRFILGFFILAAMLLLSNLVVYLNSESMIYIAMVILGVGSVLAVLLIMPYVMKVICKIVIYFSRKHHAAEWYLASQNLSNNRNNTNIIVSIVIAGIMIVASLHGMFASARESVAYYVSHAFDHDYLIECNIEDTHRLNDIVTQLENADILKDYTCVGVYNYTDDECGENFRIFGVDPDEFDNYTKLKLYTDQKDITFQNLRESGNKCFVSHQIMIEKRYKLGDMVTFGSGSQKIELQIAAYFDSFTNDGRLIYMDKKYLEDIIPASEATVMYANKAEGVSDLQFEETAKEILPPDESSILAVNVFRDSWKQEVVKGIEIFYVIFMMITVFIIFSLVNNYITSIMERKKEVGILSSLGARNVSIRKIFRYEMILMFIVILLLGISGSYATLFIFVKCLSAVFHADVHVFYPMEILVISCIVLIITFILLGSCVIKQILKTSKVELIKERTME